MAETGTGEGAKAPSFFDQLEAHELSRRDVDLWVVLDELHKRRAARALTATSPKPHTFVPSLDRPAPATRLVCPGDQVCGLRARRIIVGAVTMQKIRADQRLSRWWGEAVLTRLTIDGEIVEI